MAIKGIWGVVILTLVSACTAQVNYGKPCSSDKYNHSEIYCTGDLLRTVQKAHFFEDQKTFVDLPLRKDPHEVIDEFKKLGIVGDNISDVERAQVLQFVEENFDLNATEFDDWDPEDWKADPAFLENIENEHLKAWAEDLHGFWKELGRKIKEDVRNQSSRHSMYYVSHPVIVPGGRFKEFYYWDSYWIQRGLLVSEMSATVKGMIENFLEMVDYLGFIPNGGRIYYQRSQPPLLGPMMDSYYEATKDIEFVRRNLHLLDKEYKFFMDNRMATFMMNGKEYKMAHYNVELTEPRPESFSDDYDLVHPTNLTKEQKDELYANLKSGAESGWDFSSRWFVIEDGESLIDGTLSDTKTRNIIPVDLNSFLYWNAKIMAKFCDLIKDPAICNSDLYTTEALRKWIDNINEVMWDEQLGTWFDYDFIKGQQRKHFYPTNLAPLWVHAVHGDIREYAKRSVNYLHLSGATNFPGGVPTSMLNTGQQWDFPNGWAPLNHLVIEALEQSNEASAKDLAFELAEKWVQTNHLAYLKYDNAMFEKYDVSIMGGRGGGGEYEVVVGFGWSNGVVLDFLQRYGQRLQPVENLPTPPPLTSTTITSTTSSASHMRSAWVVLSPLMALILKYLL